MAQLISERRDIDFVLFEQLATEALLSTDRYGDLNRKMVEMVITEARAFGLKEILPTYALGDREGIRFEDGQVRVPGCFRRPFDLYRQGEWIALSEDPQLGGQGLPHVVRQAVQEYIVGANFAFAAFGTLTHGCGKMIELFGTPEQKKLFLRKIYAGQWTGTMLLTEPEAGSDVGALTTAAVKNPDGTYAITGNKIFITCGEHDLAENIIHPVLARIEGAPPGTRGISLFIVPKIWVNADGSLGEPNDVICTGVEEKLGLHGSPTCALALGGKGQCRGLLLGEENQGMRVMFHMMNEARLDVGTQGYLHGSAAYLHALDYARQRIQSRDITDARNPLAPPVPILRHPDVRRMLLRMKALVDGMRSFTFYVAHLFDRQAVAGDEEERARCQGLIALLTPVIKAYCSERGFEVCEQAIQVYGGYGYIRDYPVEQQLRDCKIASIYEGTNGIQAMDLLGRKLGMAKGRGFLALLDEIKATVDRAAAIADLAELAAEVERAAGRLAEIATGIGRKAMSTEIKTAFAFAHPFLRATGDVVLSWMHLWRATVARPKLVELAGGREPEIIQAKVATLREAAFYDGQLKTAAYFINAVLPETFGLMDAIARAESAAVDMHENSFGG